MKKIVAALLCVMMIFSTVVSVSALKENGHGYNIIVEDTFKLGDANDDGLANAIDALEIKKYCASIGSVNENGSDINCDGAVTNKDGTALLRYLAGWTLEDIDVNALDTDGDGAVTNKDGTRLLRYLAGWDVEVH